MKVYTSGIDWDDDARVYTIGIEFFEEETHVGYRFKTDLSGYGMEDFHCGMPDLEYDFFVPSDFGKDSDG